MREILFRGKQPFSGKWVEGFYVHIPWGRGGADEHLIQTIKPDGRIDAFYPVNPNTVGQCTGLCDKNGKKIFEGDILDASASWWNASGPAEHDSPIIAVEWSDYHCGFDPFANYDCDCGVYINSGECRVIGNIYDDAWMLTTDPTTLRLTLLEVDNGT